MRILVLGRNRYPQGEVIGTIKPISRVKNIKEGLTVRSFFLNWVFYIILMFVFMLPASLVIVPIIGGDPFTIVLIPSIVALLTAIFGPIILLLLYFRDRKSYSLGDGFISVRVTAFLPLMGKVIMVDDIERIRKGKSYLIFGQLIGPDRRYFRNSFSPYFQDQVYVIDLKIDHRIVQNFKVMRRPKPRNRLQRFFMNNWYPDRLAVPVHVVDRYIELELQGYKVLKEMISKSTN
jgi:hypothetical protein